MIFRLSVKNCFVKNKEWVVFPKSQYVNLNPDLSLSSSKYRFSMASAEFKKIILFNTRTCLELTHRSTCHKLRPI